MPSSATLDLDASPASARRARSFVRRRLREWGCLQLDEVATLLTSEVVSNAVLHAGTAVSLFVTSADDVLRVEVRDGEPALPRRLSVSPAAMGGRGLILVEALAHRWGTELDGSGKVVWFEVRTG